MILNDNESRQVRDYIRCKLNSEKIVFVDDVLEKIKDISGIELRPFQFVGAFHKEIFPVEEHIICTGGETGDFISRS